MGIDWKDVARLQSEQDQDEANGVRWWREASEDDKLHVWIAIQRMGGDTTSELISRFAQLGMTHAALVAERSPT